MKKLYNYLIIKKNLSHHNVWHSKNRLENNEWEYFIKLFDSNQYWSETARVIADNLNSFNINTGGSTTLAFNVIGLAGVKCYVFDENGAYIGINAITDENRAYGRHQSLSIHTIRQLLGHK
ncbi:hypothetical protein PN36_09320 [Candidatus Thiomargarita nelsonii]|uniref:Uncharacterized protein n=1 Tax=Candidatus Thiomargarita nelsonii TaxID=1003181 RepID=A0A0A6P736_9GAMM|nr:hypothetical protein PN36_09320 [Candidatus Thiomargarita nelsonii]